LAAVKVLGQQRLSASAAWMSRNAPDLAARTNIGN
jgi:hypothetical protein